MSECTIDAAPVTDHELWLALFAVVQTVEVAGSLLNIATDRQRAAMWDACPWRDRADVLEDLRSWMEVVLSGESGLRGAAA